jgi:trigger factor
VGKEAREKREDVKVTSETLPERQVRLQIEVDDERHAEAMEQAYRRLAPRVQIRGFRPGKAPRPLIEKQIGHHRLLDEAMDILIPIVYSQAIEEQEIKPIATPSVELVSHEPLVFTATVPLQPEVELGDYAKSLRVPREAVEVGEDEVEQELEGLRQRYGTIEPVERPAQKGDLVRGPLTAKTEDEQLFSGQDVEYRLTEDYLVSMPGLLDAIVGLKQGDEIDAKATAPEDFPDERLRGKEITYTGAINEIKEEKLAPLDDSFAKEVGEGFETLDALRTHLREEAQKTAEDNALHKYEGEAVDALTEMATIEYPPVMLEAEISHILEDQANLDPRDPTAQALYLARLGKTEQEVRDSVKEDAERRLKRSLVMSQFAEAENISVDEADVEQELDTLAGQAGTSADVIRRLFDNEQGRKHLRQSILTRRTLERLVEIADGEPATKTAKPAAKRATAKPAASRPPAKARRTGPRQTNEEAAAEKAETSDA